MIANWFSLYYEFSLPQTPTFFVSLIKSQVRGLPQVVRTYSKQGKRFLCSSHNAACASYVQHRCRQRAHSSYPTVLVRGKRASKWIITITWETNTERWVFHRREMGLTVQECFQRWHFSYDGIIVESCSYISKCLSGSNLEDSKAKPVVLGNSINLPSTMECCQDTFMQFHLYFLNFSKNNSNN